MISKPLEVAAPRWRWMSDSQFERIHNATLQVLERTGVKVFEPEARQLLRQAGATVSGDIVRIPSWIVEDVLSSRTPRVVLYDRSGSVACELEDSRTYCGTGSDTPFTVDVNTGEIRETVKADVENFARLCDVLPNIDFVMSMGLISDVPERVSDLHQFEAMALNTSKPIVFTTHDREGLVNIVKMSEAIVGGTENLQARPFVALYAEPSSPLMHSREAVEKVLYCAEYGLPVIYTPGVMGGATSPITSAAEIVIANAELLSGLCIANLKKRGARVIYGGMVTNMDMATAIFSYGCPEQYINQALLAEMAHRYRLPIFGTGACSDSWTLDAQAGFDLGYTLLMASMSGVNLLHDVGYLGQGKLSSPEMLVLADEAIGQVSHTLKGVEISGSTLALDVIEEIGPGGQFVTHPHTAQHFKKHQFAPKLFNRKDLVQWKAAGSTTAYQRANKKARDILGTHRPPEMPEETKRALAGIIAAAT